MPLLNHGENIWLNAAFSLTLGPLLIAGVAWATISIPRRVSNRAVRWVLWIGGSIAWVLMILLGTVEGLITAMYPPATLGVMVATYTSALVLVGAVALLVGGVYRTYNRTRTRETEVTQP